MIPREREQSESVTRFKLRTGILHNRFTALIDFTLFILGFCSESLLHAKIETLGGCTFIDILELELISLHLTTLAILRNVSSFDFF